MDRALAEAIAKLAFDLPRDALLTLAQAVETAPAPSWSVGRYAILRAVPQPNFQARVDAFLTLWRDQAPALSRQSVALALRATADAVVLTSSEPRLELAWTGPRQVEGAFRRTDQALLEVIDRATQTLLVVSFAVYRIQSVADAMVRAAQRGVRLRICVESPDANEQHQAYDTVRALGPEVTRVAEIYVWPADKRPTSPNGHLGVLHAKCAVADRDLLFLSSANLTDYALSINLELGVLIQGGTLPAQVAEQFERLVEGGILRRV